MYKSKHPFLLEINKEIEDIWEKYAALVACRYTPLTFELPEDENGKIMEGTILFVGINPSLVENLQTNSFYFTSSYEKGNRVDCAPLSYDLDKSDSQYFNAFRLAMKELKGKYEINKPWAHLDLTFVRETNQKIIEEYYFSENHQFIWSQVLLALKIIERLKPSVIVVCNAFACRILSDFDERKLETTFDFNTGAYKLYNAPLLKSSMLSGSRALDIGSRERLIWHIAQVLKRQ